MSAPSIERPDVLILGEDEPGALLHSYAYAFRALGMTVATYCVRRTWRGGLSPLAARVGNRVAESVMLRRFNARLLSDLSSVRASLVLVLKGERIAPGTIRDLRAAMRAPWVNFYPDDPFSTARSNRLAFGTAVLREYDHCFTFASALLERYRTEGVAAVSWLPFARDPEQHGPPTARRDPDHDVVFAGNLDAERVRWLEPVARTHRVVIFGEQVRAAVPRGSALARADIRPAAYGAALAEALSRGAISLNIMREQNRLSHNMRSYESLACGAFTLSQWTPELERLFRADEEVAFVRSPEELPAAVDDWLARPADRARIAAAGFARVEHDTYERRARELLSTVRVEPRRPVQSGERQ